MYSKVFEKQLINLFSEIIYVDKNPHIQIVQETYKLGGKLKYTTIKEEINLENFTLSRNSHNILIPECGSFGLIERINEIGILKKVDFFPKNIFQRLFKDKTKNLIKELENFDFDYMIVNESIYGKLKNKINSQFFVEPKMSDKIVLGKRSRLYLKKELNEIGSEFEVEYYFDKNQFVTLFLN